MKLKALLRHPWVGPLIALVAVYVVFAALRPDTFGRAHTLIEVLRHTVVVGIASVGMTMIIVSGGIDLSVGSQVALCTVVIALQTQHGASALTAATMGVLSCALVGLVIGLLVVGLRVTPFIITLGTMTIVRGVALGLAKEQKIDAPAKGLDDLLSLLPPDRSWMIFPKGVWIMILVAGVASIVLHFTRFGRHVFAVGSNEQTARLCGVRVRTTKVLVYTVAAALVGIAGVIEFGKLTVGDPTDAAGLELDVIAAVVIGGGSLAGGEGSVLGAIFGALLMTTIHEGSTFTSIPSWVQLIITGLIIIAAAGADRLRRGRR
jgi:ribose transport system permease protein